jgi:uncharacterized protein (TIGR04255 family)
MKEQVSMTAVETPLSTMTPSEVYLKHAPLVSVLAQLRFPVQPGIDERETVAPFLDVLRDTYPVVREEVVRGIVFQPFQLVDPTKVVEPKGWTIWRLFDVGNNWRVSLSRDFLALETSSAYISHGDFIHRLQQVMEALPINLRPPVIDRFGLRYVDRIKAPALLRITELVRSELLGVLNTADAKNVSQTLSESAFELTPDRLIARWGLLAPNASYDPGTLPPIAEPSWILDLDMFREATRPFDIKNLAVDARAYADRIYTFFRWAVTPKFLTYFSENQK